MKVIAVAGPKGGPGKTTLAAALAVEAARENAKVAMIDLNDDQGTLTEWWILRGRPVNPFLYDAEGTLDQLVKNLSAGYWAYCFIDCPPYQQDLIEMAVLVADIVLIPIKLAYFDASAIDNIAGMCQRRKKPYGFVINEFDDRKSFEAANAIAFAMLEGRGAILETRVSYHPKHRLGQIEGRTGAEIDKTLARETARLWTEVKALAEAAAKLKPAEGKHG
jgi:chromosome partitioning protein